jgi:hypothetical protein
VVLLVAADVNTGRKHARKDERGRWRSRYELRRGMYREALLNRERKRFFLPITAVVRL